MSIRVFFYYTSDSIMTRLKFYAAGKILTLVTHTNIGNYDFLNRGMNCKLKIN